MSGNATYYMIYISARPGAVKSVYHPSPQTHTHARTHAYTCIFEFPKALFNMKKNAP